MNRTPEQRPTQTSTTNSETSSDSQTTLLAVIGMSPAVLTETIWALAFEDPPVVPARVVVATTTQGRECLSELFKASPVLGGSSPWEALHRALSERGLNLQGRLRFGQTADDIRVITAHDRATDRSVELSDIRSRSDNQASADFLLEQVRAIVENPDSDLIVSIAGGRKTMGALLYACMTLLGRETDRLTHVLVSEPFETLRDFWFPGQPAGPIRDRDEGIHNPARATIELADVPFVPLRNLFVRELGRKAGTFSRLVDQCRQHIRERAGASIQLEVETSCPEIKVNGVPLRLPPRAHVVMLYLARRAKEGASPLPVYKAAVEEIKALCEELHEQAEDWADWRRPDKLKISFNEEDIRKATSELSKKIKTLGGQAATLASCLPERGRFSLDLTPSRIVIK